MQSPADTPGRRTGRVRVAGIAVLTGLCVAYIVWKIDVGHTVRVLAHADLAYFGLAAAITLGALVPLAWRWQRLLAARGIDEPLGWLVRAYYVSYAVAQVLPTSLGGDAARIYTTSRRHRARASAVAGSVLLERALGGAATLLLAAVGFLLSIGRYDVGAYLWLEGAIALATLAGGIVLFSRRARRPLARLVPMLRLLRIERPTRSVYEGIHGYRDHPWAMLEAFGLTVVVQSFRIASIWLVGEACGVHLSPRPYYVLGPLLFLVMLVPFTVNGIALREAFFVSFLGQLHVSADAAFATGFLFFVLSLVTGIPGAIVLAAEAAPRRRARTSPRGSERGTEWSKESPSPSFSRRTTRRSSSRTL